MKQFTKKLTSAMLLSGVLTLSGCGYNQLQALDEDTSAKWSEVVNQYQRRADLVPNLVAVVERYAEHEKEVLTEVANARSKVGSVQLTPETLTNPSAMQAYTEAQAGMTSALSRLMMVTENYPALKADTMFQDLQAQLEGTENRITVARNNYIQSVQGYNTTVRQFPTNLTAKVFGLQTKPNFSVENEKAISTAPTVNFSSTNPTQPTTNND
ncbi:MAG: LemA family protein [Moraxella sp.]|uniref:LemA family protein n=1 Tax=Moraxella sp. TaxID=479 RepID=UPI0026DC4EB6|nr:LemA family protein [Moraxella sp.]MDO4450943.1 LemA family protein [Moraxella sp.]